MAGTAPTTPNYEVNYEDERFKQNEANKQAALTESNQMYDQMRDQSEAFFNNQIEASKQWAEQQQQLQQDRTDFAVEQIEQQKAQTQKDYIKEQSGAYADWQKQSNQYGANAEQMASNGMSNTGYSESSQVAMYNTYQSRVASARQAVNEANLQYDNAMKEAILENNVTKAEIAMQALQEQLELALQGFQYGNDLLLQQTAAKQQIEANHQAQFQAILDQINQENALAEEVRQYNANLLEEQRQFNENMEFQKMLAELENDDVGTIKGTDTSTVSTQVANAVNDTVAAIGNNIASAISSFANKSTNKATASRPNTINGYGKVYSVVGANASTVEVDGKEYEVYKTGDGTQWYWNGSKYVKIPVQSQKQTTKKVNNTNIFNSILEGIRIGSLNQ